ncbi:MAG: hypothetical protein ABSE89_05430 [Sedimentisphaerales bacterium]
MKFEISENNAAVSVTAKQTRSASYSAILLRFLLRNNYGGRESYEETGYAG